MVKPNAIKLSISLSSTYLSRKREVLGEGKLLVDYFRSVIQNSTERKRVG